MPEKRRDIGDEPGTTEIFRLIKTPITDCVIGNLARDVINVVGRLESNNKREKYNIVVSVSFILNVTLPPYKIRVAKARTFLGHNVKIFL